MTTLRVKYRAKTGKRNISRSLTGFQNKSVLWSSVKIWANFLLLHNAYFLLHFSCPRFTCIHSKSWKSSQIMKSRAVTFFQALNILPYVSVMQLPEFQPVWYPALYIHKLQQIKATVGWFASVRQHSQTGTALPVALPLLQWARCHLLCKVIHKHFKGETFFLSFHSLGYEILLTVVMLSSWPVVHVQQYLLDSAWCNVSIQPH